MKQQMIDHNNFVTTSILAIFLLLLGGCAALNVGNMISGKIYKADGTILPMEIEISYGHGTINASNPRTNEKLTGTYSGVSEGYIPGAPVEKSTRYDVVATLVGNLGTVLDCTMKIQAGAWVSDIHGTGTCQDKENSKYQIQF